MLASRAVAPGSAAPVATPSLASVVREALLSTGRPLELVQRRRLETYFQHDFSQVTVHTDARAAESARMLAARAYTVGHHVVFAQGQYQPATVAGVNLLAHEMTHVKQQGARRADPGRELKLEPALAVAEQQADLAAQRMTAGGGPPMISFDNAKPSVDRLQRQVTAPPVPTTWGITLTIDEKGRVDLTVSGPSATPIVSKPTIGIRRDPDGKHYHLLVGGRDSVVTADQIPAMLKSLGGSGKPGDPISGRRIMVPTCGQLADMGNKFENYELSRKMLDVPGVATQMLPLTPELFDALVAACSTQPATASTGATSPTGPRSPTVPDFSLPASPLLAGLLGSDTLDNFGFDKATLTPQHLDEIKNHLAPRLKSLLRQYPLATISVTGHTDEVGGDAYNQGLGQRRADAVRDYLVAEPNGVPATAISTDSVGKTHPVVPTGKAEGHNRRVEVRFSPGLTRPGGLGVEPPGPKPAPPPTPAPTPTPTPAPTPTPPVPQPPGPAPGPKPAPTPQGGEAPEAKESLFRLTMQVTPQKTFPIRGTNAAQCGDWISFPVGLMFNWDGVELAKDKLSFLSQPEIDWDLVQVSCHHLGNVLIQDNILKWTLSKDLLELALVGQLSLAEDSPIGVQPGLQLSWHPLTHWGGNKELQIIGGVGLNWQPGPGNLGFVVGGGIRFEFPH